MKTKLLTTAIAFILSMEIQQNAHADLNDGLVAHWSFDDCSAKDNSGNGHDGTINGNPQCVDGVKGKALHFFNTNNSGWFDKKDWVTLPNYTGSEVSFHARVKWKSASNYDPTGAIWSIGDNSDLNHFLALWINSSNGDIWVQGQSKSVVNLSDGNWHTVAITASPSKTNFYFDNVLIESVSSTFVNFQDSPQYLSYNQWYNGGAGSSRFAGLIDETRIYNRALTEAEVLELYEGKEKVASSIDLSLALTAPASVKTAEKSTYQLTATNNGNAPATGVKAHFVVPRKSIATVDIPKNCTLNGRIIECALSDLGANQSATQTFSMTALRKGALSVVGLVSSNADDANYDDNKKSVVVSVK